MFASMIKSRSRSKKQITFSDKKIVAGKGLMLSKGPSTGDFVLITCHDKHGGEACRVCIKVQSYLSYIRYR